MGEETELEQGQGGGGGGKGGGGGDRPFPLVFSGSIDGNFFLLRSGQRVCFCTALFPPRFPPSLYMHGHLGMDRDMVSIFFFRLG